MHQNDVRLTAEDCQRWFDRHLPDCSEALRQRILETRLGATIFYTLDMVMCGCWHVMAHSAGRSQSPPGSRPARILHAAP